jgi:hypothetical protein
MDVQARWAYSEIVDSNFSTLYDDPSGHSSRIDALRRKRRSSFPFESLAPEERYLLALMCSSVRRNMMIFMTGVDRLREVRLNKTPLADLSVPPIVSGSRRFMPFKDYIETPCLEPGDARNVTDGYRPSSDPLTVGRLFDTLVLLDGYHRAASFWKFAPANASISAYVPTSF